jgi:hypothetical protein
MDGWVPGEALRSQRESPVHGRASIYYEPKGVRVLILTLTIRVVLQRSSLAQAKYTELTFTFA